MPLIPFLRSPVVDGVVIRNAEGKEVRQQTQLTEEEQEMARRICMAFGQTICGFDILRVNGRSYVNDVNGWSLVKSSAGGQHFYDKCARIFRDTFLRVARRGLTPQLRSPPQQDGQWTLKGYLSVFRHGDRTPKQKFKLITNHQALLALLPADYAGKGEVTFRSLEFRRRLLLTCQSIPGEDEPQVQRLVEILTKKMRMTGTKVVLRLLAGKGLLIVVKWGGEFTHAGRHQSKAVAEGLRQELSLMNKRLMEDVLLYTSEEGRVQATAEVFAKAFLPLAEVPFSLLQTKREWLDDISIPKDQMDEIRDTLKLELGRRLSVTLEQEDPADWLAELMRILRYHRDIMRTNLMGEEGGEARSFRWCGSESPALFHERWETLFEALLGGEGGGVRLSPSRIPEFYDALKYDAIHHRDYLIRILTLPDDDDSKASLRQLFNLTQRLFEFVAPREYGLTAEERLSIGKQISGPLLKAIVGELETIRGAETPACRLYFTKESHMVALLNIMLQSKLPIRLQEVTAPIGPALSTDNIYGELDYLSHLCFELYEKHSLRDGSVKWSIRLGLSHGAHDPHLLDRQLDARHAVAVGPRRFITDYLEATGVISELSSLLE